MAAGVTEAMRGVDGMIVVIEVVVNHNSTFSNDFPQPAWTNRGTEKRDGDGQ